MAATAFAGPAAAAPEGTIQGAGGSTAIADSYIVVLRDTADVRTLGIPAVARQLLDRHRGSLQRLYQAALPGFATHMTEANARRLAAEPAVAFVEQDHTVSSRPPRPTRRPGAWIASTSGTSR